MASFGLGSGIGSWDPIKLESDNLEDEYGPLLKRTKRSLLSDQVIAGNDLLAVPPSQYNPLNEPSPLGLRLRKTPSVLDLIQMALSQGAAKCNNITAVQSTTIPSDKVKASNFPASLLRIGGWEYASRHEGDLVVKFYFAKHKLVWECLDGGLKSKIEIQWSDIVGLNAKLPEDGPASMTILLARQPVFYRETNPQPRKHTLWQATADFTDGQASMHRKHFLQVPLGVLNKHFDKLLQCDARLNFLSRQPEILGSPYLESIPPALKDSMDPFIRTLDAKTLPTLTDGPATSVTSESIAKSKNVLLEESSPNSVMDGQSTEGSANSDAESPKDWDQVLMQGIRPSMSLSDLVNHIGSCISGQGNTDNPSFAEEGSQPRKVLEDIAHHLLGDAQVTCTDENSLMKRVDSLCCLLQQDPTVQTPVQLNTDTGFTGSEHQKDAHPHSFATESITSLNTVGSEGDFKEQSSCKAAMSRVDSYGELINNFPRNASFPKFLFNIAEDN